MCVTNVYLFLYIIFFTLVAITVQGRARKLIGRTTKSIVVIFKAEHRKNRRMKKKNKKMRVTKMQMENNFFKFFKVTRIDR